MDGNDLKLLLLVQSNGLFLLAGGWWCWDQTSFRQRVHDDKELISSSVWSSQLKIGGMWSTSSKDNSDFFDSNKIWIPYCSSDICYLASFLELWKPSFLWPLS